MHQYIFIASYLQIRQNKRFKMKGLLFVFTLIFASVTFAQKGNREQKEAMQKLRWMTGSWAGNSFANVDNEKRVTHIHETVQSSLDGTILLINVRATDADSISHKQSLAYTSFSVVSYDVANRKYRWTSWRTNGRDYEEEPFIVGGNSFEYSTKESGNEVRYKAILSNKGEFLETGEYQINNTSWQSFISMKLIKTKR